MIIENKRTVKAIPLEVYEGKRIGNCSNNGITAKCPTILVEHKDGFIDVDLDNPPENLCKVITRQLFGGEYKHIEPMKPVDAGNVGYMMGGAFAYTSDIRFKDISDYPLPIHDREEKFEKVRP